MKGLSITCILVFLLSIIGFRVLWVLRQMKKISYPEILFSDNTYDLKGSVYENYHEINIYKKLAIALVILLFDNYPSTQICFITVLHLINFGVICVVKPYSMTMLNILRGLAELLLCIYFMTLLAI